MITRKDSVLCSRILLLEIIRFNSRNILSDLILLTSQLGFLPQKASNLLMLKNMRSKKPNKKPRERRNKWEAQRHKLNLVPKSKLAKSTSLKQEIRTPTRRE